MNPEREAILQRLLQFPHDLEAAAAPLAGFNWHSDFERVTLSA